MNDPKRIAVVTGSRAEFGLLQPVMRAIDDHPGLALQVLVTGTHLLSPIRTINEVASAFRIHATIPMQANGETGRLADAASLGRGITGFAQQFALSPVDVVLVLGDRIEAFAAAVAASVGGIHVAHMHGGDRAEGVADEAMRHAITKLAHFHLPATEQSADRIIRMGENPEYVHVVGSPSIDGLSEIAPLTDAEFAVLSEPQIVFLLHPTGRAEDLEHVEAARILSVCTELGRTLALLPNHDAGSPGIAKAIHEHKDQAVAIRPHLPRKKFIGLLQRPVVLVGNSSAGLIECAALGVPCVNIGPRQGGRERGSNVIDVPQASPSTLRNAISVALKAAHKPTHALKHPFGDGNAGPRTASILAGLNLTEACLRKRNTY